MVQTHSEGPVSVPQPDKFKLRKLQVALGNTYVRLAARDRHKVMRSLKQFAFPTGSGADYSDPWSKDEMNDCHLQLKPISQKMANDLRRWASELLKAGWNYRLALQCLMDELDGRRSIEEKGYMLSAGKGYC
jgi:hypothetical protein